MTQSEVGTSWKVLLVSVCGLIYTLKTPSWLLYFSVDNVHEGGSSRSKEICRYNTIYDASEVYYRDLDQTVKNDCWVCPLCLHRMPGGQASGSSPIESSFLQAALHKEAGSWLSNQTGCVQFPSYHFGSLASFVLCVFFSEVERMSLPLRRSVGLGETARAEALGKC